MFLSIAGSIILLAVVGCTELRPYVQSILKTYNSQDVNTNKVELSIVLTNK